MIGLRGPIRQAVRSLIVLPLNCSRADLLMLIDL